MINTIRIEETGQELAISGGSKLYKHKVRLICNGSAVGFGEMGRVEFKFIFYSTDNTPITRDVFLNYIESLPSNKSGVLFKTSGEISVEWEYATYGNLSIYVHYVGLDLGTGVITCVNQTMSYDNFKLFLPETYQEQDAVYDTVSELDFSLFTQVE